MNVKPATHKPAEAHAPAADDLRAAYEIHTLVQMIAARLAAAPHWSILH